MMCIHYKTTLPEHFRKHRAHYFIEKNTPAQGDMQYP